MAIIMRSSGQKRDQGDKRKQLYTWVGCGLVGVLTLIGVLPNAGREPQAPDYSKFSSSRMQDLAALPFGSDAEAGSFLRENPEYSEVSNADLLGSLFSSEDRQERQAQDKAEGVPPPPDPEYKDIAMQKAKAEENELIKEARKQREVREKDRYNKEKENLKKKEKERVAKKNTQKKNTKKTQQQQVRNQNTRTTPGTLGSSGSRGGGGSAGTGVTGSIWRNENKDVKPGNSPANHAVTAQDIAFAKDKGRNVGLDVAAIESMKGANAGSAEGAATGAIDAFQGEVTAEDLAEDEAELGLDELPTGLNEELQNDLQRQLNDDINEQEHNNKPSSPTAPGQSCVINDKCMNSCTGAFVRSCFWSNFCTNLANSAMNWGFNCLTSGCWNNWGGGGSGENSGDGGPQINGNTSLTSNYSGLQQNTSPFSSNYQFGGQYSFGKP